MIAAGRIFEGGFAKLPPSNVRASKVPYEQCDTGDRFPPRHRPKAPAVQVFKLVTEVTL